MTTFGELIDDLVEKVQQHFCGSPFKNPPPVTIENIRMLLEILDEDDAYYPGSPAFRDLHMACSLCVLAHDYNMKTAMIYKLSDGNIDPRKEARISQSKLIGYSE